MGDTYEDARKHNTTPSRQRTSAACDACRARKVKCIFPAREAKCSVCNELDIECTRVKPRKKRGPKNRYVQALRTRFDGTAASQDFVTSSLSQTSALSPILTPRPPKATPQLSLELIAPLPVLHQLISDWFGWIHPVAPIFHRHQFTERIMRCSSTTLDASFLILVSSLCAATIASLRRRRALYGSVTVEHCLELAESLEMWSHSNPITLDSCLAMYNFSSAAHHEHGIDSPVAHRLGAEAAIGVKYLLYHGWDRMPFLDQQICKRLYWLLFAGQCTSDMHGRPLLMLHCAHEQIQSLIPLDVSDDDLLTNPPVDPGLNGNNEGSHSYVPGLNVLSRLFLIWQSSQATPNQTMENLQYYIKRTQQALEDLPPELTWKGSPSSPMSGDAQETTSSETGDFGTDVQTVNLKVTQLHIRANLLEQMNSLARTQNLLITPSILVEERHRVVDELLEVLDSMPNEVFDANGYSIIPKIRDIGSALFDELRTGSQGGNLQASLNLDRLLKKLESLDVRPLMQEPYW